MQIPEHVQNQLDQFQQLQQQAQAVTVQKQNVEVQLQETKKAIEELEKTDENSEVFKTAGTLLIKVNQPEILEEMKEKVETLELRLQTMSRQEERVLSKLKEMQTTIEAAMKGAIPPQ